MNLSSNQKLGALLAGILPLVASIYGQQAERRQQNQTRAAEQQARADTERQAADASDSAAAQQLNLAFKQMANPPAGTNPTAELCSTLHTSLELLRQSAPTPKTEAVVAAWLTYRVEGDGRRLVCDCKRTIELAHSNWLPDAPSDQKLVRADDGKSVHNGLIFALNAANTECNPDQPDRHATRPQPPTTVPPAPIRSPAGELAEPQPVPEAATQPTSARGTLTQPPPGARIYFQVPDADAKARIAEPRATLERAGYRVYDVEVVGDKRAPRCAELRYVYANDATEAGVLLSDLNKPEMLAQLYGDNLSDRPKLREFRIRRLSRYEGRALNRIYELWLPGDGGRGCSQ